jgi:hypothetical protein
VIGSVALAVRGVNVRPGDIDVITTVEGAEALGDCYRDVLVVPVADQPGFGIWGRAHRQRLDRVAAIDDYLNAGGREKQD